VEQDLPGGEAVIADPARHEHGDEQAGRHQHRHVLGGERPASAQAERGHVLTRTFSSATGRGGAGRPRPWNALSREARDWVVQTAVTTSATNRATNRQAVTSTGTYLAGSVRPPPRLSVVMCSPVPSPRPPGGAARAARGGGTPCHGRPATGSGRPRSPPAP